MSTALSKPNDKSCIMSELDLAWVQKKRNLGNFFGM
jgi:hypothetical protein